MASLVTAAELPPAAAAAGAIERCNHCDHCGLPLTGAQRARGARFCCDGCARVRDLLETAGLARYYELRRGPAAPPPEFRPDGLEWLERLPASGPADARLRTLDVQGIHCAACVWVLEELFRRHPGAVALTVNPAVGRLDLQWNDAREPLEAYVREVERFGYRLGLPRKADPRHSRGLLVRLAVSSAAAMNAMIFSLAFYFGLAPGDGLLATTFGALQFALGTVAALVGGSVFVRSAAVGLRHRVVHLDLPIALGIVVAWAGSVHEFFARGPEAAYFDTLAIFVTLMLLGRWLQERQLERNRLALLAPDDIAALGTRRAEGDRIRAVPASAIAPGDELWIVPGDLVPLAAELRDREACVRLDWIDGESAPRTFAPGAVIPAGAFNAGASPIRAAARERFADSRLHELLARPILERGGGAGGRFWSRLGTAWVAGVLLAATAGFLLWLPHGVSRALEVTVAILVVTCPCAIGIAAPLARDLVHGALRRRGIFVRSATFLDRALDVRRIAFDKTGTLTERNVALTDASRHGLAALPADERATLHALAFSSNHPVSRAIAAAIAPDGAAPLPDGEGDVPREIPGRGLAWMRAGITWRLGRRSFALDDPSVADDDAAWWSRDAVPRLALEVAEQLRSDAADEVLALRRRGYAIALLSGDAPARVAAAAARLGLSPDDACGGLAPEAKAERVRSLGARQTLFVGDGINDGPAFDAAACAGTPATDHAALPGRADFYFLGGGIAAVRLVLAAARALRRVQRANLVVSTVYNAAVLALCFAGLVTPAVAAVLMPLSSLAIVGLTVARLSGRSAWTSS